MRLYFLLIILFLFIEALGLEKLLEESKLLEKDAQQELEYLQRQEAISIEAKNESFKFLFASSYKPNKKLEDLYKYYKIVPQTVKFLPTSSLGQDTQPIKSALQKETNPVIGVGLQIGAAAWINAAAQRHNLSKIKALVLDTPYDDANEVIYRATYFDYIPGGKFIISQIGKFLFGSYDPEATQPIDAIKYISNKELPIFIIHSKNDNIFHINSSRKLYLKFKEFNFANVYLIETANRSHNQILSGRDYKLYQQTIHKFYKKFAIPYNPELLSNIIKMKNFKPSKEEILEKIEQDTSEDFYQNISKTIIILFIMYACHKNFPKTSANIQATIIFLIKLFIKTSTLIT